MMLTVCMSLHVFQDLVTKYVSTTYCDVDMCVPAVCIILLIVVSFQDYAMCIDIGIGPHCIAIQGIHHVYCYWATLYCYMYVFKEYTMCIVTGPCCIAIQGIHHVYCYWAMLYCYSRIYIPAGANSEWSFNPRRCKCIWTPTVDQ